MANSRQVTPWHCFGYLPRSWSSRPSCHWPRRGARGRRSGPDKREQFANDLDSPQLIAVTDNVNQEKADQTPDEWMPPRQDYHCTYASMWIASKHKWQLTVTESEKSALEKTLSSC